VLPEKPPLINMNRVETDAITSAILNMPMPVNRNAGNDTGTTRATSEGSSLTLLCQIFKL